MDVVNVLPSMDHGPFAGRKPILSPRHYIRYPAHKFDDEEIKSYLESISPSGEFLVHG